MVDLYGVERESALVESALAAERAFQEREVTESAEDLTRRILKILERPLYQRPHGYEPYPNREGCVRCPYARDHRIHREEEA